MKIEDVEVRGRASLPQLLDNSIQVVVVRINSCTFELVALFVPMALRHERSAFQWAQIGHHYLLYTEIVNPLQSQFDLSRDILDIIPDFLLKFYSKILSFIK